MLELRIFFAQKSVKVTLSLLLIVGGVAYAFVDTFTSLPYFFILDGLIAIVLPRLYKFLFYRNLSNRSFYIILFLLYYVPFSSQREVYREYHLKITLPANQTKTYFIVSNPALKWTDLILTWFYAEEIKVDFKDKSIVNLKRGLPNNMIINSKDIYNKNYSSSIVFGQNDNYVVLIPIGNLKKKLGGNYYDLMNKINSKSNEELLKHKIDSLENN